MDEIKEKLQEKFYKTFAEEGNIENHSTYNPDYLSADLTLQDVWSWIMENFIPVEAVVSKTVSKPVQNSGLDEKIKGIADKYGENCTECDNIGYYPICHAEGSNLELIPESVKCNFCHNMPISAFNLFKDIKKLVSNNLIIE